MKLEKAQDVGPHRPQRCVGSGDTEALPGQRTPPAPSPLQNLCSAAARGSAGIRGGKLSVAHPGVR